MAAQSKAPGTAQGGHHLCFLSALERRGEGSGSALDGRRGARAGQMDGPDGWASGLIAQLGDYARVGRPAGLLCRWGATRAVPRCLACRAGLAAAAAFHPFRSSRRASPPRRELAGPTGIIAHLQALASHGMASLASHCKTCVRAVDTAVDSRRRMPGGFFLLLPIFLTSSTARSLLTVTGRWTVDRAGRPHGDPQEPTGTTTPGWLRCYYLLPAGVLHSPCRATPP